jgi:mono/diheme cytochrome c family protein
VATFAAVLAAGALAVGTATADPGEPDGAAIYQSRCAACHGRSGKTDTANARALKVRPLVHDAKLAKMAPADIMKAIKSNPKHRGMSAVTGLDDSQLGAAAVYVKELASEP